MASAVFVHKPNSGYDDRPDQYYHFPKSYLSRVRDTVGNQIIYYGPLDGTPSRFYTAVARVTGIREDYLRADHYYADVVDYLGFDRPVDYREGGGYERKLVMPDGSINGGTAQSAVRLIEPETFAKIVEAGFSDSTFWPDRELRGDLAPEGLEENSTPFIVRPIVEQLVSRRFRDAKFRQHILNAYDRTCAFTGLRLINGGGRPEVEAAHIIPVEKNGTDSVRNGLALSATMHWMFDRGLLSLQDDFQIIQSRHLNHDISHLLRSGLIASVPSDSRLQPHSDYLKWHRENRFKE